MLVAMSKGRLAQMAGITSTTLSNYINHGYIYEKLVEETGYRKTQKILTVPQVRIILDHFVFDLDTEGIT